MMARTASELRAAIDRDGAELAHWTDRTLAGEVRSAVLADRELRRYLENAAALADGLRAARDAVDLEIEDEGAAERVSAAVMTRIAARGGRPRPARWLAIAAAVIVSACLGSYVDITVLGAHDSGGQEVVVLDPIVFGGSDIGIQ
jgi:hypothetical protein